MIIEYHRPDSLEKAFALLARVSPKTIPMGGGTNISKQKGEPIAVVDLQALGLDQIHHEGNIIRAGATSKLQKINEDSSAFDNLCRAISRDFSLNVRNQATLGGVIATADGRSVFLTSLLALDAHLVIGRERKEVNLAEWLPLRDQAVNKELILEVVIPQPGGLKWDCVARSPGDRPVVILSITFWPSGRVRAAVGGWGKTPLMLFDGPKQKGIEQVLSSSLSGAEDAFASEEYRREMIRVLAGRCLE